MFYFLMLIKIYVVTLFFKVRVRSVRMVNNVRDRSSIKSNLWRKSDFNTPIEKVSLTIINAYLYNFPFSLRKYVLFRKNIQKNS